MTDGGSPGALHGLRVVEACEGIGGPYAAMLLAEQGADVVKVEPPRGDRLRGNAAFHALNRSKRSVAIDVDTEAGRGDLRRLLQVADLFLHDWPPSRAQELGLSAEELRSVNSGLSVGWLPAFGGRGPWADLPVDEALVQAISGVSGGQYRYDPPPVFVNTPVTGYAQAIVGAIAAAATAYARSRGAPADGFEVSAVAGVFAFETAAYMHGSGTAWRSGQQDPRGPLATYRLVQGSDGEWLFCGALTPPFWTKLALALGLDDCLLDERFANAPMGITDTTVRDELKAKVDAAFLAKPRDEWLRILEEHDVPRAPAGTRAEYARDPQTVHNRMMIEVHDPQLGLTRQSNVPVWLRESPGRIRGPAPQLASTALADVLADERLATAPGGIPRARRYPLEDVVVLDLGGFIAGANGSMMLSDLGADVIKIEPFEGDGWRASGLAFFGSNRGKRGLCIDLKADQGRALFLDLVERADVVLDNMRAGIMDRLGIGFDALRARNPRIIHTSVTGYGPTGPYAHLPGFDPLMQARSGIMLAQGEPGGEPVFLQMPVCDYMTALLAAYGTVCALVARERTGRGDRVQTSLANSAFAVQAGEFIFYDGRPPDPPGARDLPGRHALYRVYATADAYLMLACRTAHEAAHALRALGVAMPAGNVLAAPVDGDLAQAIAGVLAQRANADWLDALLPLRVPIAPCTPFKDLFDDEHLAANGLWWDFEHPDWGAIRQTGAVVRWDNMSMHLPRRAPLLGEHSVECLCDLGVAAERIEALMRERMVIQRTADARGPGP